MMYDKTKAKEILELAKLVAKDSPDWYTMSNRLFGIDGPCAKAFPSPPERQGFLDGPEYAAIKKIMLELAMPHEAASEGETASGKFVVRLPKSIHGALQAEAESEGVSLNQLVLAKLALGLGRTSYAATKKTPAEQNAA